MSLKSIFLPSVCFLWFVLIMGGNRLMAAPVPRTWQVDGVSREALISLPPENPGKGKASPLVFVFHGHGGTMQHAARTFSLHTEWPEAICVYMQGLPTVGRLTDPEGKKAGWQARAGDQGDRDLKFFDAVLATLKKEQKVDPKRIYSTGHSNGGAFTYLLWGQRGDVFAAVAPSAGLAVGQFMDLKPKPVLHFVGQKDPLVKFAWQEATIAGLRRINQCSSGPPLAPGMCVFPSDTGTPVQVFIHPGGHEFLRKAPRLMVAFFKEHPTQ